MYTIANIRVLFRCIYRCGQWSTRRNRKENSVVLYIRGDGIKNPEDEGKCCLYGKTRLWVG